jgi:hypothetical protein
MTIFQDDDDDQEYQSVDELLSETPIVEPPWRRSDNTSKDDAKVTKANSSYTAPDSLRSRLLSETAGVIKSEKALAALDNQRVKRTAKRELRELYGPDFDPADAPESIDRYEEMLALRNLEHAAVEMGTRPGEGVEVESDYPHTERAIAVIQQMKSYGEVAEPYLAHVVRASAAVMPVREAAVDALADLRDQQEPSHDSLRAALAAWLRPGGD